ncbi:thyrostimulin alpha-2 subunit-like [Asterias rubens]|uniref:Glycoprotein hormone alpha-2-type 2 n=1 Tax=Asterias rubens TaxID=7604 RepID=A0A0U2PLA0_ASTRU|nr:thyrostimulin alpha-2 subunit-like [Asterias rubens]ALJ99964.1 glycoprotein hormone alpha-2-type precursor 2 [Asterias rubens]
MTMKVSVTFIYVACTAALLILVSSPVKGAWEPTAGCHLVGYRKEVRVPGCHIEYVKMNACRGYCMTYSFLSDTATLERSGGTQLFTSHGSCCSITSTHDVHITLQCENNQVYKDTFKSAKTCSCALCSTQ